MAYADTVRRAFRDARDAGGRKVVLRDKTERTLLGYRRMLTKSGKPQGAVELLFQPSVQRDRIIFGVGDFQWYNKHGKLTAMMTVWPEGAPCTGDRCLSNDHVNGRSSPRGEGVTHQDAGYALKHSWL